ncbi:MAG: heterodisulfide reductase-related iron-sulfur binding cluster [Thioalkalivibrionaceae bacterium]
MVKDSGRSAEHSQHQQPSPQNSNSIFSEPSTIPAKSDETVSPGFDAHQNDPAIRDLPEVIPTDPSELIMPDHILSLRLNAENARVAWHSPCSMTHGLRTGKRVEALLDAARFQRVPVSDAHLCCGSAGTYSLLQPDIAKVLRAQKLKALQAERPEVILTANIGCQTHLGAASRLPVVHYLVALAELLPGNQSATH